ncbi:hypothetical protein LCGC14_1752690 [marine sediment metagenome]|uniref:Ribonuclease HII n=1 Tax=marine sediment metagenome TaxID=412755 RepID=A0A0F9H3D0_9ZZZZ
MNNFSLEGSILKRLEAPAAVVGIDEVGNGAWAGPLVAGAVVLPRGKLRGLYAEIKDSKRMSARRREEVAKRIKEVASVCAVRAIMPWEIDADGFSTARTRVIALAFLIVREAMPEHKLAAILDGRDLRRLAAELHPESQAVNRADGTSISVAAASIIAKVARDRLMYAYAELFPGYGFDTNVGYGTAEHRKGLKLYGPTAIHRMSVKPVARA